MTTPRWLIDHLINTGAMTENRVTENAKPFRCTRCGLYTLRALDAPVLALEITLDAYPTTNAGETFALLTGRTTWHAHTGHKLIHREAPEIRARDANTAGNVHAEHACHSPPLPMHPTYQQHLTGASSTTPTHPPF